MYSRLFSRLSGWLFFTLGLIGLTMGHLGTYAKFSGPETGLSLALGLLGMWAARSRMRSSVLGAWSIGLTCMVWGILGLFMPSSWLGTTQPLENAVRVVVGVWGLYVSVQDVMTWRNSEIQG
ncbi:MAG: hypothetical protein A2201_11455 [Alicyclobacillus sp. RIFOXYA1_FULL_53_8]|nr:MAG: hypothetical protein A2201_11455 [Alicyclobacillus sp. RIFOXYA1_FULL_53_8]